jgi:glycine/D-amino acid oxidase-like deaminating enzyme
MTSKRAVILGAGIAGLTAALRLRQIGWDIERMHDPGSGSSSVRSCLRTGWLNILAKTLDQVRCPREVASNLKQAFIHRTQPRPATS